MLISAITERQLNPLITCLDIENAFATARISLWGGQVLSFIPRHDQRERLFVSGDARWDGSKSIRGGVPVCWPWFGVHREGRKYPTHGYVRTRPWSLLETSDETSHTRLLLQAMNTVGEGFGGHATLFLEVLVGRELTMNLITRNSGTAVFSFTAALHTYFNVADVRQCRLTGLAGPYLDNTRDWARLETPEPYRFTEATDRVHLHAAPELSIVEPACTTAIRSAGHDSIVVWNPWANNLPQLSDLGADAYTGMLCVETAVTQGLLLEPDKTHTLTQIIT